MDYIKQIDIISASEDFGVYLKDLEDFCEPAPGGFTGLAKTVGGTTQG